MNDDKERGDLKVREISRFARKRWGSGRARNAGGRRLFPERVEDFDLMAD
jgi:hypothetical protein